MAIRVARFGGRDVLLGTLNDVSEDNVNSPFVALIAASDREGVKEVLGSINRLLILGCHEFCCLGLKAECLHDQIDLIIEKAGLIDVATTWHEDPVEGCEYFLFGAGAQNLTLYGFICDHPDLLDAMNLAAK